MGFNLNKAMAAKEEILKSFTPLDLNEGNVQAIFNECIAKDRMKEIETSILFPTALGYSSKDAILIYFDKSALALEMTKIEYLYGQLYSVHSGKNKSDRLTITDIATTYTGKIWSQHNEVILQLLYLGCGKLTMPFSKEAGDTTVLRETIKPTLSQKDPAFPAWWEAHKAEWEDKG